MIKGQAFGLKGIFAATILLLIQACASGSTTVLNPASSAEKYSSITIEAAEDTVEVESELSDYYEAQLRELLYVEDGFGEGGELTARYRFIQVDKGSRAARYFVGLGAGKGSLTIETVFLNAAGEEVAKIQSGGEISGGFAGGGFQEAVGKAAKQTAEYAKSNLLAP
ncbi:MAG: DUF4410 domain-containing protein [Pseudomonadota bacterium]